MEGGGVVPLGIFSIWLMGTTIYRLLWAGLVARKKLICTRNIFKWIKVIVYGEEYAVGSFQWQCYVFLPGGRVSPLCS